MKPQLLEAKMAKLLLNTWLYEEGPLWGLEPRISDAEWDALALEVYRHKSLWKKSKYGYMFTSCSFTGDTGKDLLKEIKDRRYPVFDICKRLKMLDIKKLKKSKLKNYAYELPDTPIDISSSQDDDEVTP